VWLQHGLKVERMNRTIKEATVQRYHYDSHQQLEAHLADFVSAYNFGRRLKTLRGLTPYEFICKTWTKEPQRFRLDPLHQMRGLSLEKVVLWMIGGVTAVYWRADSGTLGSTRRMCHPSASRR
jgi:hypothetical protein